MSVKGDYMGMALSIDDLDGENIGYFKHCAEHNFHLQKCDDCSLLRYPPTTACPFCSSANVDLDAGGGEGRGVFLPGSAPRHSAGVQGEDAVYGFAGGTGHAEGQADPG